MTLRIVDVALPTSLDAPDAWPVHATVEISRTVDLALHGHDDLSLDAPTVVTSITPTPHRETRRFVAVEDGHAVGRASLTFPLVGNTHLADVYVEVAPDARRRGVGSTLWETLERAARAAGRGTLVGDSAHATEPPPGPGVLEPPTGAGRVAADDDGARFALAHGFTLAQVERHSVLDLPVEPAHLARLLADAAATAGPGFRTHVWHDAVPDERLDDLAVLQTRMTTDAPAGGLDLREEVWDAQRVRDALDEFRTSGLRFVVCAAEHVASGVLAAYTVVSLPEDRPTVVYQENTLALREHRGHRLGMLVKATLLDDLARARPALRRVHTWNAQENAHMLAINVALGFRPAGVEAEWQRREG